MTHESLCVPGHAVINNLSLMAMTNATYSLLSIKLMYTMLGKAT